MTSTDKAASLPDAIQAAATAAIAAEKKEKEKSKEIKIAKSSILANKKKMSNVLSMWKQRSHEGQAPRVALDESQTVTEDRSHSVGPAAKTKLRTDSVATRETATTAGFAAGTTVQPIGIESQDRAMTNSSGVTLKGVIRGSGLGVVKKDTLYTGSLGSSTSHSATGSSLLINSDVSTSPMPSRTDTSAMSSYTPPASAGGGKRRFSEMPSQPFPDKEQPSNITYRDRAAERRSLYGSSSFGDNLSDHGDSSKILVNVLD